MSRFLYPYEFAAHFEVRGEDAADFLQSQFSNDLRPFSVGQSTYGLWLDVKGRLVADSWVLCEDEDHFRVVSENCPVKDILEKLEHHIIADDVELERHHSSAALSIIGDQADEVLVDYAVLAAFPGRRGNLPSRELVFPDAASRGAWLEKNDGEIVSDIWIQKERIRAGMAMVGYEVKPGDMPAEVGLVDEGVSLTKGCYLGQEIVARLHNLGKPQRRLYLLSGTKGPALLPEQFINEQGKAVGELRTWVTSAEGGQGVAILKSRHVAQGMNLSADGMQYKVEQAYERTYHEA